MSDELTSVAEEKEREKESDDMGERDSWKTSAQGLVLTLIKGDIQRLMKGEEDVIYLKLSFVDARDAEFNRFALYYGGSIVARKLNDLSSSNFACKHFFELSNYTKIWFPVRWMPSKYNINIMKEIENILRAWTIKPAYSS